MPTRSIRFDILLQTLCDIFGEGNILLAVRGYEPGFRLDSVLLATSELVAHTSNPR